MEPQSENTKSEAPLRAYFLPYIAPSHFLPLLQIAKLFASRGVHVTFLTTRHNSLLFRDSVDGLAARGLPIGLDYVGFPGREVGLPEGVESFTSAQDKETAGKLFRAWFMLRGPMEDKVRAARPDFVVADMHCFWASGLGVPRLVYHGQAYFALSADRSVKRHAPYEKAESDLDPFLLPGLPDPIRMSRSELPDWLYSPSQYSQFVNMVDEGDEESYGVLVNSVEELEPGYARHYQAALGRRAWSIGPLSLHCAAALGERKEDASSTAARHPCLAWLDERPRGGVIYVSFGSMSILSPAQLTEIAHGLLSSGHPFLWALTKGSVESLPSGLEARISDSSSSSNPGMLIKGWAPQEEILGHVAVGGFLTHCGWNSVLEGATAGLPMLTWPVSAEHFYNRRLAVDVLGVGVDVGNRRWGPMIEPADEVVERGRVEEAVRELMGGGEEAEARRRRAEELGEAAKRAVEKGGSSYDGLTRVIEELRGLKKA